MVGDGTLGEARAMVCYEGRPMLWLLQSDRLASTPLSRWLRSLKEMGSHACLFQRSHDRPLRPVTIHAVRVVWGLQG